MKIMGSSTTYGGIIAVNNIDFESIVKDMRDSALKEFVSYTGTDFPIAWIEDKTFIHPKEGKSIIIRGILLSDFKDVSRLKKLFGKDYYDTTAVS